MRAVVQRVTSASVSVDGKEVGRIGGGLLVLLGVASDDSQQDVAYMARKLIGLRIFEDKGGMMNRSIMDTGGSVLVVSQFTLYGDVTRGNRPSFTRAAKGTVATSLYEDLCSGLRTAGCDVQTGVFGAHMLVTLVNDGPVTIIIDSAERRSQMSS
ncbi:MAG TPA: D-aminoacyl-tRNA deacylase [Candidatus Cryosericum sp.]|nr:D-aminoacyl-tRNA deacylase [Candidatus Cryosericum sp.]